MVKTVGRGVDIKCICYICDLFNSPLSVCQFTSSYQDFFSQQLLIFNTSNSVKARTDMFRPSGYMNIRNYILKFKSAK